MKSVAIIGAGISGLYLANLFKNNKNYKVTIYEKKDSIEINEGYGIQLSVNSVEHLNKIGFNSLTEEIRSFSSISHIKTLAPDSKNLFAISNPNPWAPPVTTAVLFLKSNLCIKFIF